MAGIVVASLIAVCVLCNLGITSSEAQIKPFYGTPPPPPPPPRVALPPECRKSPENIIQEIEQGIDQIPDCAAERRLLRRKACCTAVKKVSKSGCETVLDTAMRCCRLRFPSWTPSTIVDYACKQAMHQYGISDASEHCWRTREKRLEDVGCTETANVKKPESTGVEESM
jgi:hypothetical protein